MTTSGFEDRNFERDMQEQRSHIIAALARDKQNRDKKDRLEKELSEVRAKQDQGERRIHSGLEKLPRELRDEIYRYLFHVNLTTEAIGLDIVNFSKYVESAPPQHLRRSYLGDSVHGELVEFFYHNIRFTFLHPRKTSPRDTLSDWIRRVDCNRLRPMNHVRKLELEVDVLDLQTKEQHQHLGADLRCVLECTKLADIIIKLCPYPRVDDEGKNMEVHLPHHWPSQGWDTRIVPCLQEIFPFVSALLKAGHKVTLITIARPSWDWWRFEFQPEHTTLCEQEFAGLRREFKYEYVDWQVSDYTDPLHLIADHTGGQALKEKA